MPSSTLHVKTYKKKTYPFQRQEKFQATTIHQNQSESVAPRKEIFSLYIYISIRLNISIPDILRTPQEWLKKSSIKQMNRFEK